MLKPIRRNPAIGVNKGVRKSLDLSPDLIKEKEKIFMEMEKHLSVVLHGKEVIYWTNQYREFRGRMERAGVSREKIYETDLEFRIGSLSWGFYKKLRPDFSETQAPDSFS